MKRLIIALMLALFVGCAPEYRTPQFQVGQLVKTKVGGEKVQILNVYTYQPQYQYRCRVGGLHQNRRGGLVSADTEIVRYKTVVFYEFELEPFTK